MYKIYLRRAKKLYNISAFIYFPYDAKIIAFIKRKVAEYYYHKDLKCWEISASEYHKITEVYSRFIVIDEVDEEKETKKITSTKNLKLPKGFKFKTKPKAHQLQTVIESQKRLNFLLADEPGCGKSKQIIDIAQLHKYLGNVKHCLIVCGINNSKWNWVNEIKKHSHEKYILLGQRFRKNGNIYEGSNLDRLEDCAKLKDELFVITNIQSLRDKKILKALLEINFEMIALDESHKCNNPNSAQTSAFLKLDAKIKIPMTGTPILNKPFDVFVPLKWLGKENHSFGIFKNHYSTKNGFKIIGYRNIPELKKRVEEIQVRRKLQDCVDIPEIITKPELLIMSNKQRLIYDKAKENIIERIDKIIKNPNILTQVIRLRQATSYPVILANTDIGIKFERVIELCENVKLNNKKLLIYSNWTEVILPLYKILKQFNPALIIGGMGNKIEQEKDKLNNDDSCFCALGTIGAMGVSHNLQGASEVVFIDEPWTDADETQGIDRTRRLVGTVNKTIVRQLICKNTIDERVREIVETKKNISDYIIDGKTQNKKEFLKFLLSEEE